MRLLCPPPASVLPFPSFRASVVQEWGGKLRAAAPYYRPSDRNTSRSNCTDRLSRFEYGPGTYAFDSTPS